MEVSVEKDQYSAMLEGGAGGEVLMKGLDHRLVLLDSSE